MGNKGYDFIKTFTTITIPITIAIGLLLGSEWNTPYIVPWAIIMATMNALAGVFLKLSSNRWLYKEDYDGDLTITDYKDPDTGHPGIQLTIKRDPNELAEKSIIRLKSVDKR